MDKNRGIGKDNRLLWHIPEDLQHFKRITMGKPLIMGRRTFESIGRPLPGRLSIVMTRQQHWLCKDINGIEVAHSIEQAIAIARDHKEIMVIGGEQIYALTLPLVQRIYLTQVDACLPADAFFPAIDRDRWCLLQQPSMKVMTKTGYSLQYKVLVRNEGV